jgi:hypothetical protein
MLAARDHVAAVDHEAAQRRRLGQGTSTSARTGHGRAVPTTAVLAMLRSEMEIPQYWAEARVVGEVQGRNRVVRRFGGSDTSRDEAQQRAEARAKDALAELQAGRKVPQREQKLAYGNAGLPIREQVLARRGDIVITRNSYGAHCLNEPDVLFADIDLAGRLDPIAERRFSVMINLSIYGSLTGVLPALTQSIQWAVITVLVGFLVAIIIASLRAFLRTRPGTQARSMQVMRGRIESIARSFNCRFAVYETPNGLRALALHSTFDPTSEGTLHLLREGLFTDPAYVQMCTLQACFRARISGKPWRMGVRQIVPRPGVWPVDPDRMARREQWIAEYEAAAGKYAACRFVEEVGTTPVHPRCAEVQRVHDELSRARSDLPIA